MVEEVVGSLPDPKKPQKRRNKKRNKKLSNKKNNSSENQVVINKQGYRKYNWDEIKKFYIEGYDDSVTPMVVPKFNSSNRKFFKSARELAECFHIPASTVIAKASSEKWKQKQREWRYQYAKDLQEDSVLRNASEAINFDDSSLVNAKIANAIATIRLKDLARYVGQNSREWVKEYEYYLENKDNPDVKKPPIYDFHEYKFRALIESLQGIQNIGQKALGTDILYQEIKIKNEQLNINLQNQKLTVEHQLNAMPNLDAISAIMEGLENAGVLSVVDSYEVKPEQVEIENNTDLFLNPDGSVTPLSEVKKVDSQATEIKEENYEI